ncbi:uncharacterized protein J3R85_016510 [Psidium guajava]|nr:uncharacterized protein J3R85_016510 [Psidium guajava]
MLSLYHSAPDIVSLHSASLLEDYLGLKMWFSFHLN